MTPPTKGYQLSIFGKLLDYNKRDELIILQIDQEIQNCELNRTFVEIEAKSTIFDLIKDKKYRFSFSKHKETDIWNLINVGDFNKESCSYLHENDLIFNIVRSYAEVTPPTIQEEPGQMVIKREIPLIIKEGETGKIGIKLTNKQDQALEYEITSNLSS